jgi:hypothetical protein
LHSSQLDIAVQYSKYELYLISQESPIKASWSILGLIALDHVPSLFLNTSFFISI